MSALRDRLTYANVIATLALFISLGGGAYALSKDSVGSKQIENGTVRSKELKDDDVRAEDIEAAAVGSSEVAPDAIGAASLAPGGVGSSEIADAAVGASEIADGGVLSAEIGDGTITGADVADRSLGAADVNPTGFIGQDLVVGGALAARINDVGAGGSTNYGAISGRTGTPTNDITEHLMALPIGVDLDGLYVDSTTPLTAGQTRRIRVLFVSSYGDPPSNVGLECMIGQTNNGPQACSYIGPAIGRSGLFAIEIQNTGPGLTAADDIFVGLSAQAPLSTGPRN